MRSDETEPAFHWFYAGIIVLIIGVGSAVFGVVGASCFLGSLTFHGLSCIGGWVFLAIGFVLVGVSAAMFAAFRMEN